MAQAIRRAAGGGGGGIQPDGGVGSPQYPPFKSSTILHIQELTFYTRRPLVWLLLAEMFPLKIRSFAMGVCVFCLWIANAGAGYCQQFSGAMALMLRMVGIPSRVATGFSPGFGGVATGA